MLFHCTDISGKRDAATNGANTGTNLIKPSVCRGSGKTSEYEAWLSGYWPRRNLSQAQQIQYFKSENSCL